MAKKKASRQKKMQTRVDFTPMVDMMMLLITFFMLCTSLAKPQTMNLTMPSNDENISDKDRNAAKASQTVTIYVCGNDKIYHVDGLPKYDDPNCLKETSWGQKGIRCRAALRQRSQHRADRNAQRKPQQDTPGAEPRPLPEIRPGHKPQQGAQCLHRRHQKHFLPNGHGGALPHRQPEHHRSGAAEKAFVFVHAFNSFRPEVGFSPACCICFSIITYSIQKANDRCIRTHKPLSCRPLHFFIFLFLDMK